MNHSYLLTRRETLQQMGTGIGLLALPSLVDAAPNPLTPKSPHFRPRAKHIIHIYLNGGPSQVDTWDPKPELTRMNGKRLPAGNLTTERETGVALASPFKFRQHGESGLWCSSVFEKTASQHADKICVINSMYANTPNHEQSMRLMNTGDERLSRPSYGSWLTYGLGSENQNLPGYVALCPGLPVADSSNWRSAFLPGIYQGTYLDTRKTNVNELIDNIKNSSIPQLTSVGNSIYWHDSTENTRKNALMILTWKLASSPSNSLTGCRWKRPMRWTSLVNRNTSRSGTEPTRYTVARC